MTPPSKLNVAAVATEYPPQFVASMAFTELYDRDGHFFNCMGSGASRASVYIIAHHVFMRLGFEACIYACIT